MSVIPCSKSVICSDKERASCVFSARTADVQATVQYACRSNWWAQKVRSRSLFRIYKRHMLFTTRSDVDVVTSRSTASNILNCFYEVGADLIKYDTKHKQTSKE